MAELKIRHINYPTKSKQEAFWFNFAEGFGRAAGWGVVIGISILTINYFADNDASGPRQEKQEQLQ